MMETFICWLWSINILTCCKKDLSQWTLFIEAYNLRTVWLAQSLSVCLAVQVLPLPHPALRKFGTRSHEHSNCVVIQSVTILSPWPRDDTAPQPNWQTDCHSNNRHSSCSSSAVVFAVTVIDWLWATVTGSFHGISLRSRRYEED